MRATFRLVMIPCILGTLLAAGILVQRQTIQPQTPTVITGLDLGFRIDSRKGSTPLVSWPCQSTASGGRSRVSGGCLSGWWRGRIPGAA
jgi:hypothetical protein